MRNEVKTSRASARILIMASLSIFDITREPVDEWFLGDVRRKVNSEKDREVFSHPFCKAQHSRHR